MTTERVANFLAGPSSLPVEVLQQAASEMLNYRKQGFGVMEMSHRSKEFAEICTEAEADMRKLMNIPKEYKVLFLQGGCTGMFAAVAMNFLKGKADYICTGTWSEKAAKEAEKYGQVNYVVPKPEKYLGVPSTDQWKLSPDADYVYYCFNETVGGVEFENIPETNGVPLIVDMSSNIMTRKIDITKFAAVIAGAQKNLGPAGLTMVIAREDMLGKEQKICPTVWNFKKQADAESRLNTPPCYCIYMTGLVFKWILKNGGVDYFHDLNTKKSKLLYDTIDDSLGFYKPIINEGSRSRVNIVFRVGGPQGDIDVEKKFVEKAKENGLVGLSGHRSVGGCRASLYNPVTLEQVQKLCKFMKDFQMQNQN